VLSDRRDHPTANEVINVVFNPQEHRARSATTCFKQELAGIEVLGQEHKVPVACVLEKHGIFGGTSANTAPMKRINSGSPPTRSEFRFISTRVRILPTP
jgi:hypothetical protein